jgi:hypothetical protein
VISVREFKQAIASAELDDDDVIEEIVITEYSVVNKLEVWVAPLRGSNNQKVKILGPS